MIGQTLQIGAALLVLWGFAGLQLRWFPARSRIYLVLNLVGSSVLATIAVIHRDWGFVLLETTWAVVSMVGLIRFLSAGRSPRNADPDSSDR